MAESGARPARSREWGTCPPGRSATASSVCSWEFRAARINPIHSRAELPASSTNSPLTIRTWKTGGTAVTSTRDETERKQKAYPSPCLPARSALPGEPACPHRAGVWASRLGSSGESISFCRRFDSFILTHLWVGPSSTRRCLGRAVAGLEGVAALRG